MIERIEKLFKFLKTDEAAVITSPENRYYFLGFKSSAGVLVVTDEKAYFLIDFRYYEKASKEISGAEVILCESLYTQLAEILKNHNIIRVLPETEFVTLSGAERLKKGLSDFEIVLKNDLSSYISKMRAIKTKTEIEFITRAQNITDKTFDYILNMIKAGVSEKEIALSMEFFMRKEGSDGIAFDIIAVSGKNSSLPHGVPTDKKIEIGDFLTMDFGAKWNGYCSDMTRTVAIGDITEKQKKVYDTVLLAQKEALKAIRPQVPCKEIDKIARDIINDAGFEGCFGHGLGHSLGLEIHESPACNTRDDTPLEAGMLMTVEPGIYIENEFGVRIEDMVVVTENGCMNLTNSPKELIIL